jgi:lysophospholipase L1-like esterase
VLSGVLAAAAGCGGDGAPTTPSGPPPGGSTIVYGAIGASDVMGYGASRPCLPFADCPDSTGYVFVAAQQLRARGFTVSLDNRGVPGAVISSRVQALGRQYGRTDIVANFIDQLAPFLRPETTVVSIFAGGNDVNVITTALGGGAGGTNPQAYIDQQVQAFGEDYAALLAEVRRRAPSARVVLLNLPNLGALPYVAAASLAQRQAAQRLSVRMTTTVINPLRSQTVSVVDLMCEPRLYQPSNLSSDGFHPNDSGYAILANGVVNAITSTAHPAPAATCPQMTLVPS